MFASNKSAAPSSSKLFVEDVFSTYLYTGNSGTQTITNGIDLAGKGGLVWIKTRDTATTHILQDTARGVNSQLQSNTANPQFTDNTQITSFNSSGFSLGDNSGAGGGYWTNISPRNYASWTFRKAPKFFDVVTWTGDGVSGRQIAHALGVAPGMILVKCTNLAADWGGYHRSVGATKYITINQTWPAYAASGYWNDTEPTSTNFTVGNSIQTNGSGYTYVAYLFAHDTTSDGIIQCGSYTGNGSTNGPSVTLGWEPQWVMIKKSSSGTAPSDWYMFDNMRGMPVASAQTQFLFANTNSSEIADTTAIAPTATGFQLVRNYGGTNANGETYIYIAIRRGPMRTPTSGTSVFASALGSTSRPAINSGFPVDAYFGLYRAGASPWMSSRLQGAAGIETASTAAEYADATQKWDYMDGVINSNLNSNYAGDMFRRAPSFFDEVCWTGSGASRSLNHNLGVAPELIISKPRSATGDWYTLFAAEPRELILNGTSAGSTSVAYDWGTGSSYVAPTSSVFTVGPSIFTNNSGTNYVAYLFASCPGVSKVGSYTGNGTTQTIDCGFTAGARFVLIKRTDSTGDWYVFDTARGMTTLTNPYLRLNSTAAETSTLGAVTTTSVGFSVNASVLAAINTSGASYIFLAIA